MISENKYSAKVCWDNRHFKVGFKSLINSVSFILQRVSDRPLAKISQFKMGSFWNLSQRVIRHSLRKIKETLLIKDLKPTLNEYVSSEKLCLY